MSGSWGGPGVLQVEVVLAGHQLLLPWDEPSGEGGLGHAGGGGAESGDVYVWGHGVTRPLTVT